MLDERFSKSNLNKSDVILHKTRKDVLPSTSLPLVNGIASLYPIESSRVLVNVIWYSMFAHSSHDNR